MIEQFRDGWLSRTPRERILLSVLGVLVCAILLWALVWRPTNAFLQSARAEQAEALDRLARTKAMVAEAKRATPATAATDVGNVISQSAIEAGFTLAKNDQQQAGQYSVAITSVKSRALFVWLGGLERQGVIAQTANVRSNGDGTVAFDAVLRGRGE